MKQLEVQNTESHGCCILIGPCLQYRGCPYGSLEAAKILKTRVSLAHRTCTQDVESARIALDGLGQKKMATPNALVSNVHGGTGLARDIYAPCLYLLVIYWKSLTDQALTS